MATNDSFRNAIVMDSGTRPYPDEENVAKRGIRAVPVSDESLLLGELSYLIELRLYECEAELNK